LREWLSPEQLAQYDANSYFDVIGCDSGKRYRIQQGNSMNIHEIDGAGHPRVGWCFVPNGYRGNARLLCLHCQDRTYQCASRDH
jgi:hypothetical protein